MMKKDVVMMLEVGMAIKATKVAPEEFMVMVSLFLWAKISRFYYKILL